MQSTLKDWLVRTKTGEIIGPFSQSELMEEVKKKTFTSEDEIAPAFGHWISAATLQHHEADEMTLTSTRSQTFTRSSAGATRGATALNQNQDEDLTPTPDFSSGKTPQAHLKAAPKPVSVERYRNRSLLLAMTAISLLIAIGLILQRAPSSSTESARANLAMPPIEESQFIQEIYSQIRAGQPQAALKILTRYHEKGPAKGDKEYVIPYAALLITERESLGRARKMLEELIGSSASPLLKSRAHHWLGYLLLSQDEADMGEGHFLEALQLNPREAATRFNLGRAYLKQEKYQQALEYLQLAELEAPELWLIQIYKGQALVSLGNINEARLAFKTAIQLEPDRWIGYVYRALFLTGTNETEAAQSLLKKMLTRDPQYEVQSPPPFGFFQERVNYDEYLNPFAKIMDKSGSEEGEVGQVYLNYLARGTQAEGKELEQLAEKKGTLFTKVLALKSLLDRDAPNEDLKAGVLRLPQNLSPFGFFAFVLRGEARFRLGQNTEAQQDFQRALGLEPKAAAARMGMVRVLAKTNRVQEATSELHQLISFHPEYIPAITFPLPPAPSR